MAVQDLVRGIGDGGKKAISVLRGFAVHPCGREHIINLSIL